MNDQKINELDRQLVLASKKIKVLNTLAWPAGAEELFLGGWRKGNPQLPEIIIHPPKLEENISTLDGINKKCDQQNPAEKFLAETALSYANAGRMLMAAGTKDFTRYSTEIYGRPDVEYKQKGITPVDSAKFFLEVTINLLGNSAIKPIKTDISAQDFANWLRIEADKFFVHDKVEVVLDPEMSSKALAGSRRIRIRSTAVFSQLDKDQLLLHEAFVHSATQLNGMKQNNMKSLGLGAPRTTRTQEGIAVLAEIINNAMDISRLRRIVLRVLAVKKALDGADFIDLFKFFLEEGQSEEESVRSAQRVFRGGGVKDGVVFTKDSVYLEGLVEVHTFIRMAIRDNRPELVSNLFAGRLTLADVLRLDPLFRKGWLAPPVYIPAWALDLQRLSALMAYSAFISNVKLDDISLDRAIEMEDELKSS